MMHPRTKDMEEIVREGRSAPSTPWSRHPLPSQSVWSEPAAMSTSGCLRTPGRSSARQDLRGTHQDISAYVSKWTSQTDGIRMLLSSLVRSEEHTSELQSLRHLVCR